MKAAVSRRNNCRMCHGTDLELVLPIAATPIGDAYVPTERLHHVQAAYPTDLYLCHGCGSVQLLDVVAPEELYVHYTYETSISLGLAEHFKTSVNRVLRCAHPPHGAFAVDIGSNDGTMLKHFRTRGMRVLGIDPAGEVARKANASGIETLQRFFTCRLASRIRKERGPATIITANNTLANIDDVDDFVKGVRTLLAPDGVFVFETGYLVDLIEKDLLDTIYHEHVSYFSVRPLVGFFHRHGLELVEVERLAAKGGSLRGTVQLVGGPRAVSPSVQRLMRLESRLGVDRAEPFRALTARTDRVKQQLQRLLNDLKTQGRATAGYGASVGVTTLLYHFELGELLTFLVDDNPVKHHVFSPGLYLPVLPSHVLYERKPDCVLILAWRYVEPILQRHRAFLEQGGQFIVPLPTVKIIGPSRNSASWKF